MESNVSNLISQLDAETKRQLAFQLLKEVLGEKKAELENQVDALRKREEELEHYLELIEKKKQEFMPEYDRITKIFNALDFATTHISTKLAQVRDQLRIVEDKFNRYISRLEKALANA